MIPGLAMAAAALVTAAVATAALLTVGSALAQSFPNKTVSLVVPYPAGGVSDVIARSLNTVLAKQLGQPVIVENISGASGGIGAQKVLQAPGDGHLIFQGGPNELILAPWPTAPSSTAARISDWCR